MQLCRDITILARVLCGEEVVDLSTLKDDLH